MESDNTKMNGMPTTEDKEEWIGFVKCANCESTDAKVMGDWGGEATVLCADCGAELGVLDLYYIRDENIIHPESCDPDA